MVFVGYDELNKIIADAGIAYDYAWEHFDELSNRRATYTLYGPKSYAFGAADPCSSVKPWQREMRKSTKRKEYMRYELDAKYNLIRNICVENYNTIDCVYQIFELNGVRYAHPFFMGEKCLYDEVIHAIKYQKGRPIYSAEIRKNRLFVEFYEYVSDSRVAVTCYDYFPNTQRSWCGLPVSFDAPYGASNSPIALTSFEMPVPCVDFSKLFMDE